MSPLVSMRLNAVGLLAISAILLAAFADQIFNHDLPCPLCILQRAGFVAAGMGLALNLRFGPRPSHYGIIIVPGTGFYGDALLELHFYTWAFIVAVLVVIGGAVMLLFDRQFVSDPRFHARLTGFALISFALAGLLALGNGVSTVLECGGGLCPENPTGYLLLR